MCTEEKIKVYAVENDTMASHVFKQIFADSKTYDFEITKVAGNDSANIERSRDEDKKYLMDILTERNFHILILDLLLRDGMTFDQEEIVGSEFSGIENVLSLEIARQLKSLQDKHDFLLVFTSSSTICRTHQQFEDIRDKHGDIVPEDAVFIFKPEEEFEDVFFNCPINIGANGTACDKEKRGRNGCSQKECFLKLLDKYYEEFQKRKRNGQ